ncbi:MAG TPA: SRPBCC family protein [Xanthobacteraceae bacterium]|nr:SRPBCC family protein [Xanthobacteraceae bacterium]
MSNTSNGYGALIEPATVRIERVLPGPIERVWAYLTESDLRRQWLASGVMEKKAGTPFELVWRNNELTNPTGERPEGITGEHSMQSRITEFDPPRKLAFTWQDSGDVTIELEAKGNEVLLTLIHRRLPNRSNLLGVSAGWHLHLDILVARMGGNEPAPIWDSWRRLRKEYEGRIPA